MFDPEWRREKKGNLLLLDRLTAIHAANPKPQIAIALHCNASRNKRYGGFMAIYRRDKGGKVDARSKRLAELLCSELKPALSGDPGIRSLGPQADTGSWVSRDLAFTRWAKARGCVGVILELGFLTCAKDVQVLKKADTPAKVARAILSAVEKMR